MTINGLRFRRQEIRAELERETDAARVAELQAELAEIERRFDAIGQADRARRAEAEREQAARRRERDEVEARARAAEARRQWLTKTWPVLVAQQRSRVSVARDALRDAEARLAQIEAQGRA